MNRVAVANGIEGLEVYQTDDSFRACWPAVNEYGQKSDWFPTMAAAKRAAAENYKYLCTIRGVDAPKRVTWRMLS